VVRITSFGCIVVHFLQKGVDFLLYAGVSVSLIVIVSGPIFLGSSHSQYLWLTKHVYPRVKSRTLSIITTKRRHYNNNNNNNIPFHHHGDGDEDDTADLPSTLFIY
jgi:hypothetical protein